MARTITSPGVQISEKDLSLRTTTPAGTNVLVPGFAAQGPISEPLVITTASELEAIYGVPTTPAERYFYYSCKEVLNSPAVLTTVRLPYGQDSGSGFSSSYSGLFYPMASGFAIQQDESGNDTLITEWKVGNPVHITLSPQQYSKLMEGDFDWLGTASGTSYTTVSSVTTPSLSSSKGVNAVGSSLVNKAGTITVQAGFVILNDLQTAVNELAEGYYVGFVDNSSMMASSPDFNSILQMQTLTGTDNTGGKFATVATTRLDFSLSATATDSSRGVNSVSEQLEKVGFIGFEKSNYQDHISLGIFKLRRSTSEGTLLSIATSERYLGSLDYNRRQVSQTGGLLSNAYIEDIINNSSPTVKVMINPAVSRAFDWTVNSSTPTSRVTISNEAKKLYAVGVYVQDTRSLEVTKIIGNVPGKLDKALRVLETPENSVVDVVCDAGLSTIYSVTDYLNVDSYNDESYIDNTIYLANGWQGVVNQLVEFCENTRKDCVAIIDPPRSVFVSGKDTKVIDAEDKNFTQNIYNPLRLLMGTLETNFAATYGNWIKVQDIFSGRRTWIPFSGYASAIYARNDAIANPWSAPAGLNRGIFNAVDIAFNPNQKQRDRLYEISVNPVVFFTGDGYSIMGQKTLQTKPTAFDRINVRRLFLALERAVQRTLKYFVFEPNTEFTRTRLRSTITPLFEFAKNTEGLYDYLIVVDERNNTPDTIDNNELIVDIYIKPVRTAEFVLVNFVATRTGQDFQELI
jgi:hypothetical protein